MVSRKHFVICILLAMSKNAVSKESVDYSNNVINATTMEPKHMPSTSNFTGTSSSHSSIFPDTAGRNEIETTTKLDKTYEGESLPNKGAKEIITNSLNSTDNFNGESKSTRKAEMDITPTANADKNSENIDIDKNVTTSNKRIFDNLINGSIAETTSTTIIDKISNNFTEKISKKSTTNKFKVKCDSYEIIEHDEFKNKINKTCVELLPETTTKSEEIKTTVSSEEQKEIKTPLLYLTKADYISSTKLKENDNRNTSFSQKHVTTQTDVNKPAIPNVTTTLSAEARLRNNSDRSTERNTLANRTVSYDQVGTSSTPYIKLPTLTRRKEKFGANGSLMAYYIIGSALVAAILIASGILYLRNLGRNGYHEIEQNEDIPLL